MASPSCSVLCVTVPLIARVAVQFVTSSSLEVVTHLTTNGGRDVQHYYVGLCGMMYTLYDLVICIQMTASICIVCL